MQIAILNSSLKIQTLWKNPNFFMHLPLKKNKDVNPTKANHWGMNLNHLALAKQELSTL